MRHLSTRRLAALVAVLALAIFSTSAFAGSGDVTAAIVKDVAADGHVDGNYTAAQLRTALNSPLLAQYGGAGGVAGVQAALTHTPGTGHTSGNLPFTGSDIALFLVIGGVLVVAGVGLRRFGRNTPPVS